MAATVKGTAYIVGIGSVALTNYIPVEFTKETSEASELVRDGDGVAKARVIKDTEDRYTVRGNYSTLPTLAAGTVVTLTLDVGGTVGIYVETVRRTRNEGVAVVELTGIKQAGFTYS